MDGKARVNFDYAGLFVTDDEWIHPTRTEVTWELVCVTEGRVCLREGERHLQLEKGDVILLEPGREHAGTEPSFGRTSFFWVHFRCEDVDALGMDRRVIRGFSGGSLFRRLLHVANTGGYPEYAADAVLLSLMAELALAGREQAEPESAGAAVKAAKEAAEWIRINSDRGLTVAGTAERFGYNGEYLSKVFRSVFGRSLKQYICETRMGHACDLLCGTSLSVGEIAAQLSFENENRFIKFFKYHRGCSPTEFRSSSFNIHMNRK